MITLIFNLGDVVSRYLISVKMFKLRNIWIGHLLNISKIFLIYVNILCIQSHSPFFASISTKTALVFLQGFINGYLCVFYIEKSSNRFTSIYNRNRAGYFNSYSIISGLTLGSILSYFWRV